MHDVIVNILLALFVGLLATFMFSTVSSWQKSRSSKRKVRTLSTKLEIDLSNPEESTQTLLSLIGSPQVFLAYSNEDREFAQRLANDLRAFGIQTWLTEEHLKPGDDLRKKFYEGLRSSGYFIPIISKAFQQSEWTKRELELAVVRGRKNLIPRIIPVLIDNVELPTLIRYIKYADLRTNYNNGVKEIAETIKSTSPERQDTRIAT